ncbi:MFS transporter [Paenibacillus humicola]|uniref:MFS transporter n=1 Tax=Paenibacillus humicola TaxID=3110540 RepID=UPI00237A5861|nr:MFS transporter [Paenibacillus humicola]
MKTNSVLDAGTIDPERGRLKRAWISTIIISLLLTVDYMDRGALSVATPFIREEFHMSPTAFGALVSIFAWPYAFSLLLAGALVDRWGSRVLLSIAAVLWSVSAGAMGAVSTVGQFFGLRISLGITESPAYMSAARANKLWFTEREQHVPTGIWNSTSSLGPALAPLLLTPVMLAWGWRAMFITIGAVGVVLAVIWYTYYRERPSFAGTITPMKETAKISFSEWLKIFRHRTPLFLAIGSFFGGYWGFTLLGWLPGYLEISRKVSIAETGVLASLPYLAGFLGAILGGRSPNFFMARGLDRITSCKIGLVGGSLINALMIIPAVLSGSVTVSIICFTIGGFFGSFSSTNSWTTIQTVSPVSRVGSIGGIWNWGGFMGSGVGPFVTGLLIQMTGSFVVPLLLGSLLLFIQVACYWFGIKEAVPET